jgi:hypothetical protein
MGFAPGESGEAFAFDGQSSYLEVPNSRLWDVATNDFTIEFWANFSQVPSSTPVGDASAAFIGHDEGGGLRNKWLFGFDGDLLYFYVNGPGSGSHFLAEASFSAVTNQWYHLALTKKGPVYAIYANGVTLSIQTNTLPVPLANAPLTIGKAQDLYFAGLLDEISFYTTALDSAEIASVYRAGAQGKCGGSQSEQIRLAMSPPTGTAGVLEISGGTPGVTFVIQASDDLRQWTELGRVSNSGGVTEFSDAAGFSLARRYYRVAVGP